MLFLPSPAFGKKLVLGHQAKPTPVKGSRKYATDHLKGRPGRIANCSLWKAGLTEDEYQQIRSQSIILKIPFVYLSK